MTRPPLRRPADERFRDLYEPCPTTGCWIWMGVTSKKGYGFFEHRIRHLEGK